MTVARSGWPYFLRGVIRAERDELPAVIAGFLLFFCLFTGYSMLRPLRVTMGITAGVDQLQWLFTATFVTMLLAVPVYGACSARIRRARFLPWSYAFFTSHLLLFAVALHIDAGSIWLARVFYVWLSVFNLFVVSIAWSLMSDVFQPQQARRLFAPMAAGASAGGVVGPLLGSALVAVVGHAGLALIAALLIALTLVPARWLLRWRARSGAGLLPRDESPQQPIGGSMFAGLALIARSPFLLGISLFVVLLATSSTFLYIEQARLVALTFPDRVRQTQVFGLLDALVQSLTIFVQVFVTSRLAARGGVTLLLTAVPLLVAAGMLALAFAPVFAVLATVMVLRRAGEYALIRPGREMLFTAVDAETKYKAKNVIDTAVYRGGDAVSGWVKTAIDAIGLGAWLAALIGAALAAIWAVLGYVLGRRHDQQSASTATPHVNKAG